MVNSRGYKSRYNNHMTKGSTAKKADRALKIIKKMQKEPDLKYKDNTASVSLANTWSIVHISNVEQGLQQEGDRVANKIRCTSISGRVHLVMPGVTGGDQLVRIVVLQDKMPNGANPAIGDVFELTTDVIAQYNEQHLRQRFVFLLDKTIPLNALASNTAISRRYFFKFHKRITYPIFFDAGASSISSLVKNSLFFMFLTDEATNPATIDYSLRLRYKDI